jgi:Putative zinc-finger
MRMGERGMPSIDRHPSPEQLVAYHERRLSPDEAEDVRAHLVACADCTAQLLALADLLDGEDVSGADEISREDLDAAWQRQRERLLPGAPVVSLKDRKTGPPPPRWSWATAASLGLAAALALVVVGQWRTIARLEQPRANPPLVNLEPADSARRGDPESPELRLPEGTERAWVILNPAEEPDTSPYDIEITAADGRVILRFTDIRSSEAGNFRLEVLSAALEAGDYKIRLIHRKTGQRKAVEEFELKVVASPR